MENLSEIQQALKAPKDQRNDFGKYNYRTAEGIIHAFKSLGLRGANLTLSDDIKLVGEQIFVISTATLTVGEKAWTTTAGAMHPLQKKGMDASQITGAASSYARKYALNGLFAIDDSRDDPDQKDNTKKNGNPHGQGIQDAWKNSVMDGLPEGASARDRANAFAEAIIRDIDAKTGVKALQNLWSSKANYIAQFETNYPDLHGDVLEAYAKAKTRINSEEAA